MGQRPRQTLLLGRPTSHGRHQFLAACATLVIPVRAMLSRSAPFIGWKPTVVNETMLWPTATKTMSETASIACVFTFARRARVWSPRLGKERQFRVSVAVCPFSVDLMVEHSVSAFAIA